MTVSSAPSNRTSNEIHENELNEIDDWLSLMDYANTRGVSLSTLRRYIKSNKVPFRLENGKYFLPATLKLETPYSKNAQKFSGASAHGESMHQEALQEELKRAHEEIAELKTLIALYEEATHDV